MMPPATQIREQNEQDPGRVASAMNRFQRGQGPCRANLHNGVLPNHLPVNHIVDTSCPLTKFEYGLNLLHEADDDAVIWLESTASLAK